MTDDPYFFEFAVGPPVEYLLQKIEEEAQEPRPGPVEVPTKVKSRTMWDLPDPYMKKEKK